MDTLFTTTNTQWQVYLMGHGGDPIYAGKEILEEQYQNDGQSVCVPG